MINEIIQTPGHRDFVASYSVDVLSETWTVPWESISDVEVLPQYTMSSDIWVLPLAWVAWGPQRRLGMRTIDFTRSLPTTWQRSEPRAEFALRRLKRMAFLLFTRTLRLRERVKSPPQPGSWAQHVRGLLAVAKTALSITGLGSAQSTCEDGDPIFAALLGSQFKSKVLDEHSSDLARVAPRLNALAQTSSFDDWHVTKVPPESGKNPDSRTWAPFSDDFTYLLADSALWFAEVLGPDVLRCWAGLRKLREQRITTSNPLKAKVQRDVYVKSFVTSSLPTDQSFKYSIKLKMHKDGRYQIIEVNRWSDLDPDSLRQLAAKIQASHAIILGLCMAPRNGELASLPRECLRTLDDLSLVRGYTFKLSETFEERDWPIPRVAVAAIRQQQVIASLLDPAGDHLFVSFRQERSRLYATEKLLLKPTAFTDAIVIPGRGPLTSLCSGNVHSHRLRKTVARLAALSLVGANQILFDILGHRDPEMTMNYILADPLLQEEMQQITKEAAIAIAQSAFDNSDGNGGAARDKVSHLAARLKVRSANDELGNSSLLEAAKLLSQDGRVTLVRKGVLCTKTTNQRGECNRSIGIPDIGNCSVSCLHRLELAAARHDRTRAVFQILDEMKASGPLLRRWWQAQLLTQLYPFEDLRLELLGNAQVQAALIDIPDHLIARLWTSGKEEADRLLEDLR